METSEAKEEDPITEEISPPEEKKAPDENLPDLEVEKETNHDKMASSKTFKEIHSPERLLFQKSNLQDSSLRAEGDGKETIQVDVEKENFPENLDHHDPSRLSEDVHKKTRNSKPDRTEINPNEDLQRHTPSKVPSKPLNHHENSHIEHLIADSGLNKKNKTGNEEIKTDDDRSTSEEETTNKKETVEKLSENEEKIAIEKERHHQKTKTKSFFSKPDGKGELLSDQSLFEVFKDKKKKIIEKPHDIIHYSSEIEKSLSKLEKMFEYDEKTRVPDPYENIELNLDFNEQFNCKKPTKTQRKSCYITTSAELPPNPQILILPTRIMQKPAPLVKHISQMNCEFDQTPL